MDCDKLVTNINPCATTTPFRRWEEVGYIIPYVDIRNVVISGADVNFDTVGNAYSVRDRRSTPFAGSGSEFVRGDKGSVTWTERVNFPALANSVENATIANMLANGGRVVVILKQVDYESTGKGKYQVFGIDGGLRVDGAPFDPYADAAWDITLIAERAGQSAVYLWDTDEATTDAKYSLITDYEYITGLSLASGTVTPQLVYLEVDSDKTCYVILPDGSTLTSTDGKINTTWTGAAGAVTLIVPNNTEELLLTNADFIGELNTLFTGTLYCYDCTSLTTLSAPMATNLYCNSCTSLTTLSAPMATNLECDNCTSLTTLSAPNATAIYASGCDLTTVAIAALLAELVATGNEDGTLDISGGSTADYGIWSAQAQADAATLDSRGWTLTYNT